MRARQPVPSCRTGRSNWPDWWAELGLNPKLLPEFKPEPKPMPSSSVPLSSVPEPEPEP